MSKSQYLIPVFLQEFTGICCTPGGTRTHTSFRTLELKSNGSTNSPTRVFVIYLRQDVDSNHGLIVLSDTVF